MKKFRAVFYIEYPEIEAKTREEAVEIAKGDLEMLINSSLDVEDIFETYVEEI